MIFKKKNVDKGYGISDKDYETLHETGILDKLNKYLSGIKEQRYTELMNADYGVDMIVGELKGIESCMSAFESMNRYYKNLNKEK